MIIHILNRQKLWHPNAAELKKLAKFFLSKSAFGAVASLPEPSPGGRRPPFRQQADPPMRTRMSRWAVRSARGSCRRPNLKKCPVELSLLLTDDAGIRQINRQFFDRDRATDVISFTLRPLSRNGRLAGEIAINVERAIREGKKRGGFEHEFALYLAHGCDHLAGHDDRMVKERERMRRRELRWLKEASLRKLFLFMPLRIP